MAASAHSIISDDNFQTSCLPFPPDSPHYAHLIPIGSKGPVPGVATYDNGSCLDAPDNSEKKSTNYTSDPLEESLVVSPYSSRPHLLELKDLDESSRLLARALTVMRHVREDYATAPYAHAFNWQEVMQQFRKVTRGQNIKQWRENMFYIVVFRSRLASGTDPSYIGYLDELSHAEAMKTGGLLKYWFGSPNEERRNLATCEFSNLYPQKPLTINAECSRHMAKPPRRPAWQCRQGTSASRQANSIYVRRVEGRTI